MSWLSRALHYLWTQVSTVWRSVSPQIKADFERFASEFADIALEEIGKQAMLAISGQQKLDGAASAVLARAEAEGWRILKTAAITLVQDVYTATKATAGPLVVPPQADEDTVRAFEERVANPSPNS